MAGGAAAWRLKSPLRAFRRQEADPGVRRATGPLSGEFIC